MRPRALNFPLLALALLGLAACRLGPPSAPEPSATATEAKPPVPYAPVAPPTLGPAAARDVREKTELYEFAYSYPAAAAAIPDLRDWLEADLAKTRTGLVSNAKEGRDASKESDFPFNAYSASRNWNIVTDLPGWLSLSTLAGDYSGGAHPNYAYDAVLWDKAANRRRATMDLFVSPDALKTAVLKAFCAELTRQRTKKRGGDAVGDPTDEFNTCIDPLQQTMIVGSKGGKGFDRIGFLIAPYNAGPYAEGSYEVTLPVSAVLFAAVKPEYRKTFVAP